MLRESGTTKLSVVRNPTAADADPFLQAVRQAAAGEFDVLGEIGRGNDGTIVYLARDLKVKKLVALKLQRDGAMADEFALEMLKQLESSMPGLESRCSKCGKSLMGWGRFCTYCGADLSGAPVAADAAERAMLLEAVRSAAEGEYDVLGEMERREGGGVVYFARDLKTGKIVALRLTKEVQDGQESYALGLTMAMKPLAASLGVKPLATQVLQAQAKPAAPAPAPAAPKPAPPPAPPKAAAAAPPPLPGTPPPAPPASGGGNAKLIVGAVAALAVIAAIVMLTLPSGDAPPAAATPEPAPSAAAAAPPAATPAPAAPANAPAPAPATTAAPAPAPSAATASVDSGTVRVSGLPRGAALTVDGRGRRAGAIRLPTGRHTFAVSAPGYQPYTEVLDVRSGTRNWTPTLERVAAPPAPAATAPAPAASQQPPAPATPTGPSCGAAYDAKQWNTAADACLVLANNGDALAQYYMGRLYEDGRGVRKNTEEAKAWYRKAIAQGSADAKKRLDAIELAEARQRRPF